MYDKLLGGTEFIMSRATSTPGLSANSSVGYADGSFVSMFSSGCLLSESPRPSLPSDSRRVQIVRVILVPSMKFFCAVQLSFKRKTLSFCENDLRFGRYIGKARTSRGIMLELKNDGLVQLENVEASG
jgi:hypothetical protein